MNPIYEDGDETFEVQEVQAGPASTASRFAVVLREPPVPAVVFLIQPDPKRGSVRIVSANNLQVAKYIVRVGATSGKAAAEQAMETITRAATRVVDVAHGVLGSGPAFTDRDAAHAAFLSTVKGMADRVTAETGVRFKFLREY